MPEPSFVSDAEPQPLINCEYFLVEYAPSPLRDIRVPIGLFLFDASGQLMRHAFTQDWRRVRCLDPQTDLALLANLQQYFDQNIITPEQLLQMRDDFSGSLQISQSRGVRTSNPE